MLHVRLVTAGTLAVTLMGVALALPTAAAPLQLDERWGVITLAPMLSQVTPAVVNISVRTRLDRPRNPLFDDDPFFRRFFDLPRRPPSSWTPAAATC